MKFLPFLAFALLAGCQTAAPVPPLPTPVRVAPAQPPAAAPVAPPPVAPVAPDLRSRQQAQLIEALISQNDALVAQLAARGNSAAATLAEPPSAPDATPAVPAPVTGPVLPSDDDALAPNADGIIDLAASAATPAAVGDPVNPFAVRAVPGPTREVSLVVGGVILGAAPCALVNKRLVQAGDRVESFLVEQVEAGGVLLRYNAHRLRLPVSPQPTRIKLAL